MSLFRMPSLGADMECGRIVQWLVTPGARVKRGDVVVVVETDKGAIEVECWQDGVVERLLVEQGEVPVGTPIAELQSLDEPSAPDSIRPQPATTEKPSASAAKAEQPPRVSPRARRLAETLEVDLQLLAGHGPITGDDVERAAAAATTAATVKHEVPTTGTRSDEMRRAIAKLMGRSKQEVPHYYLATTIDMHHALRWLEQVNDERSVEQRVLPATLLLKASALAAREVPGLNGFWLDDHFEPSEAIHLGVAVSLRGGGLLAPAIQHADRLALDELMQALRDLVQRVRGGRLRSSQMSTATITVTSLGDRGVELVHGVIYPPQVALVGLGAIVQRPWVVEGQVVARPVVTATLAADHRASDGHLGGRYLAALGRLLQQPERLNQAAPRSEQTERPRASGGG